MSEVTRLEQLAIERTHHLVSLSARHFGVPIPHPQIRFDLRGKAAGMALFPPRGEMLIRYNKGMLADNGLDFIEQTVAHEVAHLVARTVYGSRIKPHGPEWQSTMRLFGVEPVRCHRFEVPRSARRTLRHYPYQCACSEHSLSAIRHRRSLSGVVYLCRRCGTALTPRAPAEG